MSKLTKWLTGALLLVLSATAYGFYQQQAEQAMLDELVLQLSRTLGAANTKASIDAEYQLRAIRYQVEKNRNQPGDVMLLGQASALRSRTSGLVDTLRACRLALLQASGYADNTTGPPLSAKTVTLPSGPAALIAIGAQLRQQLAAYHGMVRELYPVYVMKLPALKPGNESAAMSLSDVAELENRILGTEEQILKLLSSRLGASEPRAQIIAVARVESNRVAPGASFRIQPALIKVLSGPSVRMTCNGKPLQIGPDGGGLVTLIAPTKPGPAAWNGIIHARLAGRDSTFQVRVAYRVAQH